MIALLPLLAGVTASRTARLTVPLSSTVSGSSPRIDSTRTTWDSVYSDSQAKRGESRYGVLCARCHQAELGGADESPALTGGAFLGNWNGHPLSELQERIRTGMPPSSPGSFGLQDITDVVAYLLAYNGFPAGTTDLPVEEMALKGIVFVAERR